MKDWEYNVSLVLGVASLVLVVWLISASRGNEKLQEQLRDQQVEIDRGNASRQVGGKIIQDMVGSAQTNQNMRAALEKFGITPSAQSGASVKVDKPAGTAVSSRKQGSDARTKDKTSKNSVGK